MIVVGIDPGKTGGIAAVTLQENFVMAEPTRVVRPLKGKGRPEYDVSWMVSILGGGGDLAVLDPIRLVAEAKRWKEYHILIPNDKVIFQIKDMELRPNSLSAEGIYDIMLLIDGRRTVTQIIQSTGRTRIAVYRALTSLFVQGIIERRIKPEELQKRHINVAAILNIFLPLFK